MTTERSFEAVGIIWDDDITKRLLDVDVIEGAVHLSMYVNDGDDGVYSVPLSKKRCHELQLMLSRAEKRIS